ncbi:imidazolonepropionase [Sneathiella glossodoripedis]|uniref:imidazolonepropionase n=1 Tax=Sneathiella glossodoripedis TaxID=418853 RepID=UPI0004705196|nr:imidazolonepropionase [Sneathiella glossodoripedis]
MTNQLLKNGRLVTFDEDIAEQYGLVEKGAIAVSNGEIQWVGEFEDIPQAYRQYEAVDLEGRLVTPTFIDCHTHLVHGGNRAREFEMRLQGASYEDIARAGGGIISTVKATRGKSVEELVEDALPRLDSLIAEGVAVVEIKSGYGLTTEEELKMLRAARELQQRREVIIKTTYLAAHAIPPEYENKSDEYIDQIVLPGMEIGHEEGLIDAVDAFCEGIAFSPSQVERVFNKAKSLDLDIKIHAEQLSNLKGTELAARYGALSADHLEYLEEDGVAAMKTSGTVAVLLPGAFYFLRENKLPPIQSLRDYSVPIALATDCNPGSSPVSSLLLILNLACTLFRLTPEEALKGITLNAAKALGIEKDFGAIKAGKKSSFAIWDAEHPAELAYRAGFNPLHSMYRGDEK